MAKKRKRTSVVVGHREDGTPVKKYPSASSGTKLGKKVDELKRIHGAGGPGELADILFDEYARKWLRGKKGEISEGSLTAYTCQVENYLIPAFGDMQVQYILQSDIKESLADITGATINYKHEILARLKSIFRQSVIDGIRKDNPAQYIRNKVDNEPKRRALTTEEKAAALKVISDSPRSNAAVLTAIDYYTSCRRGEAFGIQWKHVDFKNKKIQIAQQMRKKKVVGCEITKTLKTANSYRKMPMPQKLYDVLWPLRGLPDAYVLQVGGSHYRPADVERLMAEIKTKYPALVELTQHFYRHDYATEMHKIGVPVKVAARRMGESIKTMLDTYVHIEDEDNEGEDIPECRKFDPEEYSALDMKVAKSLPREDAE